MYDEFDEFLRNDLYEAALLQMYNDVNKDEYDEDLNEKEN